jgi:FHS family Na+ dependent glucose MFS transporter 1
MLPNIADQVGAGLGQIGIIITASSIGFTTANLLIGKLYDRIKGHWLIMTALTLIGITIAIMPTVKNLYWLIMLFFLTGVFRGVIILGTNTLPLWIHGENSAPVMNALQGFFGAGSILGPMFVAQALMITGTTNWVFWASAIGYMLLVPAAFMIPSPPIRKAPIKNPKSAAAHTINENYQIIFLMALFLVFYVGAEVSFGSWVTTYAKTLLPIDLEYRAFQLASAFWFMMMAGRFLSVLITRRIGTEKLLGMNLAGMTGSLGLILLSNGNWPVLFLGTLLLGLSMSSIFPLVFALAEQVMDVTGRISSLLFVGASLGSIIFPFLIGLLIEQIDPDSAMITLLLMTITAAMIYGFLYLSIRRNKTKHKG